jgi:hypothetical protein
LALYAEARGAPNTRELLESAQAFFAALGHSGQRRWRARSSDVGTSSRH